MASELDVPRVSSTKPVVALVLAMTTVVVLAPASPVLESRLVPLAPGSAWEHPSGTTITSTRPSTRALPERSAFRIPFQNRTKPQQRQAN